MRAANHGVVQAVGAYVGQRRIPFVIEQPRFLRQRIIRPADMHAAGRHVELRNDDLQTLRVNVYRGTGLDNFLYGFHARPNAGKATECKTVQAEVQHLLHRRREKHWQAAGFENVVALVRGGAAFGYVVVTGDGQHAAPSRGARHIAMLEHVRRAVHARAFAIPNAEHAIEFVVAGRRKAELLRAPQSRGCQFFVDTGLEHDVLRLQMLARAPQRLVVIAQRRTTVAADEACGVFASQLVALALQHGQPHQRLYPAHESASVLERVFVVELYGFQGFAYVFGQGGVHAYSNFCQ